jgi:hypothetical protein
LQRIFNFQDYQFRNFESEREKANGMKNGMFKRNKKNKKRSDIHDLLMGE